MTTPLLLSKKERGTDEDDSISVSDFGAASSELFDEESETSTSCAEGAEDDAAAVGFGGGGGHAAAASSRAAKESKKRETNEILALARKETNHVRTWRLVVLIVIALMGAAVTACTFVFLKREEVDDYEDSYDIFVQNIRDSSEKQFKELSIAYRQMADTITASAVSRGETFPYVKVPLFEVPAQNTRKLSGTEMFAWVPLVLDRKEWVRYSIQEQGWWDESREIAESGKNMLLHQTSYSNESLRQFIWSRNETGHVAPAPAEAAYAPIWYCSPPPFSATFLNYNMLAEPYVDRMIHVLLVTRDGLLSEANPTLSRLAGVAVTPEDHEAFHDQYVDDMSNRTAFDRPHSVHLQPVFSRLNDETAPMVGFLAAVIPWDRYLSNLLPEGVDGITAVLKNNCGQSYTYMLKGNKAEYMGKGDLHEHAYNNTEQAISLTQYMRPETEHAGGHCVYSFHIYSTSEYQDSSKSNIPMIFTIVVSAIFVLMVFTFCTYDRFVARRNAKVVDAAARSNAIISSLFPTQVRDRLFAEKAEEETNRMKSQGTKTKLKSMMANGDFIDANDVDDDDGVMYKSKPIADLFPETTIMFADIAGFTAWSSVREPSQVFTLLETLYRAFDEIAKKRRVYKVETVGDCYVAATGLPDPRKDHAVAMARFARDIMFRMKILSKKLEVTLGPDTGDLGMRAGLHSGPVTAGVLRGERSRFQLFGDTMNTAARMEHTGVRDKIQLSQDTADLLIAAGKSNWIIKREDTVTPKGKGEMQTYWLTHSSRGDTATIGDMSSTHGSDIESDDTEREAQKALLADVSDKKVVRLIEWNVDVLVRLLKQIVARRRACPVPESELCEPNEEQFMSKTIHPFNEVEEIITLPTFNARAVQNQEDPENIQLDPLVTQQLHRFVCNIASLYRDNDFHNFEHASHVTMSVVKLLSRIVAPQDVEVDEIADRTEGKQIVASTLHDHTYGITSDPLTQFACVFSALIHDADHHGVPNAQLVKENDEMAIQYENKSVAEQNSVDLAWNLLMDKEYKELRAVIYQTDAELRRFRKLVVNSVMATDIVDKELKTLRNGRWDKAFSETVEVAGSRDSVNRKATIVIEHLIQASDVAHTMQHWHIYRKWNERFFCECYQAYMDGRAEKDPAEGWYLGEIGFFDFYIIPLARKLKDCGVFGVSSDEYLNYAIKNRQEWELRGREVVDEMIELVNKKKESVSALQAQNLATIETPVQNDSSARQA